MNWDKENKKHQEKITEKGTYDGPIFMNNYQTVVDNYGGKGIVARGSNHGAIYWWWLAI